MRNRETVERVKGTSILLGEDCSQERAIQARLADCLESFGYAAIEVPVLEHTDLYLRKSGAEVVAKTYSFVDQGGRRISLRPEFTASVIRAFVEQGEALPLPVRWHYAGPVFRYERPQRGRYRQFTQQGAEMIGAAGPRADAEVIQLACRGLEALGLERYRLVVGHVGLTLSFLDSLSLAERTRTFLLASLEDLAKKDRGTAYVRERLEELGLAGPGEGEARLRGLLEGLDEAQAHEVVQALLDSVNIGLGGGRRPEEIVDRLVRKLRRGDERERVEIALAFMSKLGRIAGPPAEALPEAEALVRGYGLDPAPLGNLRTMVDMLEQGGMDAARLILDFGLARGLAYYTGMVFEVYHDGLAEESGGADRQVCGGGRYDGLVRALGGRRDVPALGFAYGVERLREALRAEGRVLLAGERVPQVLVAAASGAFGYALRVAEELRRQGLRVEVDTRERTARANLAYAGRRGIPRVALVEEVDAGRGQYRVRDMRTGEEEYATLGAAQ